MLGLAHHSPYKNYSLNSLFYRVQKKCEAIKKLHIMHATGDIGRAYY